MKSKQLGLTEYNDAILSIYGANPVANLKGAKGKTTAPDLKKDPKKEKSKPKTGTLLKETLRLRNTAVLNLKLAKKIQKYEKERLSQLKAVLSKDATSEEKAVIRKSKKDEEDLKKPKSFPLRFLKAIKDLIKKGLKNLWKKIIPKAIRSRLRLLRKRVARFRKAVKTNLKRKWRNFTKPLRQLRRKFIDPIKRKFQNLQRRYNVLSKRFKNNLTRPFRQATRFLEEAVKDPGKQFRIAKEAVQGKVTKAQEVVSTKFQQGRKAVTEGFGALREGANKLFNQGTGAANKFKDRLFGGFRRAVDAVTPIAQKTKDVVTKAINVAKDPETYKKIANQFQEKIGKPIAELGGKAKGVLTDALEKVWMHPKVQKIAKSQISQKVLKKLGTKGGGKLLMKLVPGLNIGIALWDMVNYVIKGDMEGAIIALGEAIPFAGWGFVALNLTRELFPEWYAQNIRKTLTGVESKEQLNNQFIEGMTAVQGEYGAAAFSEGGIIPAKPQLVIVGEGGEKEYIVPESKLAYFLGSDAAIDFLNLGGSSVVSTVSEYLGKLGIAGETKSKISEFRDAQDLPEKSTSNVKNIRPFGSAIKDISGKIIEFVSSGFEGLLEPLTKVVEWIKKNILENPLVKGIGGIVSSFFGAPASAATMDMSGRNPGRTNLNIDPSKFSPDGAFNTGLKTGKSAYIGGSSDYHIDTKFSSSLSMEEKVRMMDQLAAGYAAQGRNIEFSNSAIANTIYDPNASFEEKSALLQKAFEAHNLPRGRAIDQGGFNSIDYYAPLIEDSQATGGKGRFRSSVEGQDILIPTVGGADVNYSQGGAYGAFVTLTDDQGNVLLKTGHGDVRTAKSGSVDVSALNKDTTVGEDPNIEAEENMFVQALNQRIAQQQGTPAPSIVPMPIPLTSPSSGSILFNTPAWGHASVLGN